MCPSLSQQPLRLLKNNQCIIEKPYKNAQDALLKVLFKNSDWFQSGPFSKTHCFFKKGPENHQILNFFHFW